MNVYYFEEIVLKLLLEKEFYSAQIIHKMSMHFIYRNHGLCVAVDYFLEKIVIPVYVYCPYFYFNQGIDENRPTKQSHFNINKNHKSRVQYSNMIY